MCPDGLSRAGGCGRVAENPAETAGICFSVGAASSARFECPCRNRLAEQGGGQILLRWDAGEGGLVAAGVLFPEREVAGVGFQIALQHRRLDSIGMLGISLGIDELVVSRPRGARFCFKVGAKNNQTAVALAEMAQNWLGIPREKQV